ncbi:hypothetical protein [Citrobacter koseri]|uniref:hypothetical protein n=1 Tax=Citrobacter koseri TaxID=545 RepID=UPI0024B7CAA6|nr:hypothetical protein [Citrobacter koseri]MDI9803470.1 hypothetical protein [Citrobacter koseri]
MRSIAIRRLTLPDGGVTPYPAYKTCARRPDKMRSIAIRRLTLPDGGVTPYPTYKTCAS